MSFNVKTHLYKKTDKFRANQNCMDLPAISSMEDTVDFDTDVANCIGSIIQRGIYFLIGLTLSNEHDSALGEDRIRS